MTTIKEALPTCSSCRYWTEDGRYADEMGSCDLPFEAGPVELIDLAHGLGNRTAVLLTHEDFGCNAWEAREE